MKSSNSVLLLVSVFVFVLVTQFTCSEAQLDDFFRPVTTGIRQGLSSVREGFTRLMQPVRGWLGGNRRSGGSFFDQVPLVGSCDRIAYQGVANCMTNFRPTNFAKGQCCAWRKYRACINGLRSGVRWAAQTERCPSHSFSRATINSISDRLVGFPLSACGSNPCGKRG